MLSRSQAKTFFLGGTILASGAFLWMTIDSFQKMPELTNSDQLDPQVVHGKRVLDIEMESLLVLSEALEGYIEEEVAVASFRSNTRNDVRFGVLKGFEDPWTQLRRVAPGLAPHGYTRIGAAVRHATAMLDLAKARQKLLLLVSDGKPTDYDRYEGRYGVEDVAQAVREAHQRRIHTFGLAVEKEAKSYLAKMLGPGAYRILPRTDQLPDVMAEVFVGMLTR